MAEINISNLGGGGGGTLTLTTTGTGGASTYVAGVLNIPVYQSALTNPVTGTGTATRVAFWDSASSVSSSANLYWDDSNSRLGVGTATPGAPLQVNGTGLTSSTTSVIVKDSGGTDNLTVSDDGAVFVRGVLTVTGSSASNSATLMGRTVSGEVASVSLGTNLSFSGNTLNATGGGTPAGSTGEVQFNNAGAFGASSNFNWDNTNSRLGIRTATPGASLQIVGAGTTSGTSSFLVQNSTPTELFRIKDNGDTNIGTGLNWDNVNNRLGIGGAAASVPLYVYGSIYTDGITSRAQTSTSASFSGGTIVLNASGTVGVRVGSQGTFIGGTNTTTTSNCEIRGRSAVAGATALVVRNSTPTDILKIENDGKNTYWATNTASGTTGAQTINRPSGTVNFAAAASALTVTNALCTTSSIVFATVRTNDTTAYIKNVVPGAGSFTINLGAAANAETSVGFWIIN
jgi:hypothetical protein